MTNSEKDLIEGFNTGYIIDRYRPELAKQLVDGISKSEAPFVEGFIAGSKESVKEREQTRSKGIARLKGLAKGRIPKPTKDRDRGDKEIEIDR